jgi:hypothetical protein
MNKPAVVIPIIIIVNACIWGLVMILSSRALSGTGAYQQIQGTLAAGAGVSLVVVGGGLGGLAKTLKSNG